MATHVGTSGVVKVGANTVAEVVGFNLDETNDTVEDTNLSIDEISLKFDSECSSIICLTVLS